MKIGKSGFSSSNHQSRFFFGSELDFQMVSLSMYRQTVIICSLIGMGLSFYAFYVETRKSTDPTYRAACDINESMSCSRVLTSRWGRGFGFLPSDSLFNLPTSIFGLMYYCLTLILNQSVQSKTLARLRVFLSILTNLGSVYLAYILYFVLQDFCFVCFGMYVVNFLLLICNFKLLTLTKMVKAKPKKQQKQVTRLTVTNTNIPIKKKI